MRTLTTGALALATALTLAACGVVAGPPMSEADLVAPDATATEPVTTSTSSGFSQTYEDIGGTKRAKLDPASVQITECRATKDDFTDIGAGISYGVEATFKVKNTSELTGTVTVTVNYENARNEVVTYGIPGASNIRPGKTAKVSDSQMVEEGDFPGGKIVCDVIEAEVYVPTD